MADMTARRGGERGRWRGNRRGNDAGAAEPGAEDAEGRAAMRHGTCCCGDEFGFVSSVAVVMQATLFKGFIQTTE
jgi:hypothetical protein